jgi:hypothetical protein
VAWLLDVRCPLVATRCVLLLAVAGMCPLGTSFIDTPNGDLNYDNDLLDPIVDSGTLRSLNPMNRPTGAWEQHPAQRYGRPAGSLFSRVAVQEGHFYYECSNRGLCDRSTGLCQCFTG